MIIKKTKQCLAAYNKKQEFDGATIEINQMQCDSSYKNTNDNKSIITIKDAL